MPDQPLCGEFAFQARFKRRDDLHEKALRRCRQFFISLPSARRDWLSLGTTKTGRVYRLKGYPPQAHACGRRIAVNERRQRASFPPIDSGVQGGMVHQVTPMYIAVLL